LDGAEIRKDMHVALIIALAFVAWTALSLPVGLVMGRLLKRSHVQLGA